MITPSSSKNFQIELTEMNKHGENGLMKMIQKTSQFLITKKRYQVIKILDTLFICVWSEQWEKIEQS